jgi:hypothetical protein
LDSVDESASRNGLVAERPRHIESELGRYLAALRIGSSILRNCEFVDEVALKELGYDEFTEGWCQILMSVMASIQDSADGDELGDASPDPMLRLLVGMLPSENPAMAKYLRNLIIPNVIFSLATESIGTSKLRLIMERHAKAKGATIQRLLDVFLAIDLRLPHWIEKCDALLRSCRKNQYVSELILRSYFRYLWC